MPGRNSRVVLISPLPQMSPASYRARWVYFLALLAGVLIIYLPGLSNELVFDDSILADGTFLRDYGGLAAIKQRTLSYGSFVWVETLFGEGWWKQRLVNLALHFAVALTLFALFRLLSEHVRWPQELAQRADFAASRVAAVFVGVTLFAFNPVAVYAVAYLIQRSILMATLFVALACLLFARGVLRGSKLHHAGAFVCYVAAVLSKEHAVMAPALAVPLYIFLRRPGPATVLALVAGAAAVAGAAVVALMTVYGSIIGVPFDELSRIYVDQLKALDPTIEDRSYALSIVNQAALFFRYGLLWFLPNVMWMSVDLRPAFPLSVLSLPHALGAAGFVALFLCAGYLVLRRAGVSGFFGLCLCFPLILFSTEFSTVWIQDPFVLYRSYLWAIAVPGLAMLLLVEMKPKTIHVLGLTICVLLVGLSLERVLSFKHTLSLWSDAVVKVDLDAPANAVGRWRPYLNRGSYYLEHGMSSLAYADFAKADALGELQGFAQFNMGMSLTLMKKPDHALQSFNLAEQRGFKEPSLYYHRAVARATIGHFEEAVDDFAVAIQGLDDERFRRDARLRRADAAMKARQYDVAVEEFSALNASDPDNYQVRLGLAMAYLGKKDVVTSKPLLDQLIGEKPHPAAYYGRALAHRMQGRTDEALADLDRAIALNPGNAAYKALREQLGEAGRPPTGLH